MCLIAVYVEERGRSRPAERVFSDAAHIECLEGRVVVTGLFGERKNLEGEVRSIDLIDNKVILER